jgi:tetratricopeptide (TPR) repeat protein
MGREERALRKDEQRVMRLSGQAARLLARGSVAQALTVTGEALGAARALAQPDPARYRALLARTLVIRADALRRAGRDDEASQLTEEAVFEYRALPADTDPAFHAQAVHHMAVVLARAGRWTEALPLDEEAIGIYRRLAAASGGGNFAPLLGSATTALLVHAYALGEGAREWSIELQRRDPALCMQLDQVTAALDENPAVFIQACERFGGPPDLSAPLDDSAEPSLAATSSVQRRGRGAFRGAGHLRSGRARRG